MHFDARKSGRSLPRTGLLTAAVALGAAAFANAPVQAQVACCFDDGSCMEINDTDCMDQGGAPGVMGSTCAMSVCCTSMAFGTLDISDPIFNRVAGSGVNLNCNLGLSLSGIGTAVRYEAIPIHSPAGGVLSAEIQTEGTTIGDTTMALYCDPFDPSAPTMHIVSFDDDDGPGVLSAFYPVDAIALNADTRYWLVVSTYGNGVFGDFALCLGGGYSVIGDADHDGILDDVDLCFGDQSSGDADGDGVCDDVDQCDSDANKSDPGVCGCGVSDADSDGDSVPDCIDGCPNDPNKLEPGACGCGAPDDDSDGDGVANCVDGCPDDAGKLEPGLCGCGQPDQDSDGDGWLDCFDNCPFNANSGQADEDGDGIGDVCDNCASTANADQADSDSDGIGDACASPPAGSSAPCGSGMPMLLLAGAASFAGLRRRRMTLMVGPDSTIAP